MVLVLVSIFIILHGLVHLLYLGHSQGAFEMQPGMTWPDGSWLFSHWCAASTTRLVCSLMLALAALLFAAGGLGLLVLQAWWRLFVIAAAVFSSLVYLLLWDGTRRKMDNQGFIGIAINLALLVSLLGLNWPSLTA